MDDYRGFGKDGLDADDVASGVASGVDSGLNTDLDSGAATATAHDGDVSDTQIAVGTDERRMHVRAYNHWVSLLGGRAYPSIADLDPANIADFGPHSVLLDFSTGIANPAIAFLGRALREECALDAQVTHIAQVPSRSLLSRLTDHYLQIIANRSPIGFEAEFVNTRGHNTMYRGILMPFSSDGGGDEDTIDFIYGVINWKELVDPAMQARLDAEVAAVIAAPKAAPPPPVWADGPSAGFDAAENSETPVEGEMPSTSGTSLGDRLMLAQQTAAAVRAADTRSRATLYRALGRAHDFVAAADADPHGYEALLGSAGIAVQLRAPMTPVAKLVFGRDYDKTRLTEYAAVLAHARRVGVATGALGGFLESFEGGIKGVVKAERAARTPSQKVARDDRAMLADRPVLGTVAIGSGRTVGDYVVLLARVGEGSEVHVVAAIDDAGLTDRAMRAAV